MKKGEYTFSVITALAMGFSMLVSYVRAKAESLGLNPKEGIMRRQERVFIMAVSLLLDSIFQYITQKIIFLPFGIAIILAGSFITSIIRFKKSYDELEKKEKKNEK
jgi:phosphatidylglycerophosphate synthase